LYKIHHANRAYGPVYLIKVDLANDFYRIRLSDSHLPALGVAFPNLPHEPPLVALPLVLPMGWVASPPYFCALTETAADLANSNLRQFRQAPPHPLNSIANNPNNEQPVSRFKNPSCPTSRLQPTGTTVPLVPLSYRRTPPLSSAAQLPLEVADSTSCCTRPLASNGQCHPLSPKMVPAESTTRPFASKGQSMLLSPTMVSASLCRPAPFLARPTPLEQPHSVQPFQHHTPTRPLSYVDVYMDDFLGLAQGHPGRRNNVRSTIFHAIDEVLRPLSPCDDPHRKQPISMKKLHKGDAKWSTRKILLGWLVDTVAETISLPDHRADRLVDILSSLLQRRRISLKMWQQQLGELRSMVLAIPGGRGLFSTLYTGLTQDEAIASPKASRVRLSPPLQDALQDLSYLANDLRSRPTRIGEVTDSLPAAFGAADASGLGMGGVWLSGDPSFTPTVWRNPFSSVIQKQLVTWENKSGSITNSDLELLAQIASHDILINLRDCRERTIATFTDNMSARAWQRKGSKATLGPAAYLLRVHALHQRHHRYRSTSDYIPGPVNVMADDASRLLHLSDTELLSHFNTTYPQSKLWQLSHLQPRMLSALITALQCKRSDPALFLPEPNPVMPIGFDGCNIVKIATLIQRSKHHPIQLPLSKSLPNDIVPAKLPPAVNLFDLAQWKLPSAPSARRWPAWGPQTPVSTRRVTSTISSNNNFAATPAWTLQHPV
jgi:hypothetical protein